MSPHTVMVMLEAKAGKESELKESLLKIADLSRQEESCIEYRLYQNPDYPSKFGLYEQWKSRELHQQQFSKPYILEFVGRVDALLVRPYEGFIGQELSVAS